MAAISFLSLIKRLRSLVIQKLLRLELPPPYTERSQLRLFYLKTSLRADAGHVEEVISVGLGMPWCSPAGEERGLGISA